MRLRMIGEIDMTGDSAAADIRRDVAQGIELGDITGMSVRWDPVDDPTPRNGLSKSHWAYSDAGARSYAPPMYFSTSRVLEGSIVGVPADAEALIGRSQDLEKPEHVRAFYRELTQGDPHVEAIQYAASLEARIEALETAREIQNELPGEEPVEVAPEVEAVAATVESVERSEAPVDVASIASVLAELNQPILNEKLKRELIEIVSDAARGGASLELVAPYVKQLLYKTKGAII